MIESNLEQYDAVCQTFQTPLTMDANNAITHYNLGNAQSASSRFEEAAASYRRALDIEANFADALNNLGSTLLNLGRAEEAVAAYRRMSEIQPDNAHAFHNLGQALRSVGDIEQAARTIDRALQLDKHNPSTLFLRGRCFQQQGDFNRALEHFRRAVEVESADAGLLYLLGNAFKELEEYDEAAGCYRRALEIDPNAVQTRFDLGNTLKHQGQLDAARRCYQHVLELKPDDPDALVCLADVLKQQDRLPEAANCYRRVLCVQPERTVWQLWIAALCPAVLNTNEEIDGYREQLAASIQKVSEDGLRLDASELTTLGCPAPYNLQFHGRDDRAIKSAFARLFKDNYEQPPPAARNGKPAIGFVVTNGHEGVFLRFMQGVLERIDGRKFELTVVCSPNGAQRIRRRLQDRSIGTLVIGHHVQQAANIIREARFDVLYYWEIGSDVTNYFLPFFRPAPLQCTSGGLPATSGIPQIDYFLSSRHAEPAGADEHYSEKLILADSQLSFQKRLQLPDNPTSRDSFGFTSNEHLYVCAQKIEKFHPDFDPLLAGILRHDARGRVVIPKDQHGYAAAKLQQRFAAAYPDVAERVVFLPRLSLDKYASLLAVSDVLLDPLHYGGGLTAYDGFSLSKPIVTLPGQLARGRYTDACYRTMGIGDCVAGDANDYVNIAVALGTDANHRRDVQKKIEQASPLLFEDAAAVTDYERIFEQLVAEVR